MWNNTGSEAGHRVLPGITKPTKIRNQPITKPDRWIQAKPVAAHCCVAGKARSVQSGGRVGPAGPVRIDLEYQV